ncbi:hypothetical protein DFQ11_104144 [Winogradskyella epiphytica]|uniref:Uncharacterized protein n=2 Tax=Winogradskyella epiphytica TaxID=262005 RepID=A0A2V4YCB6_9FLAO|nr:hypothetical protein DFQ11_104144 [Winogradskyella epiphytica]GGW68372.1 hypothetical protein GCM10008085_20390 [Winogradskyella epiphytica]
MVQILGMKIQLLFIAILVLLTSCNVTESIVFNKDMSGDFKSSFDMSPMLNFANSQKSDAEKEQKAKEQKMDTTIVFSSLMETYKDSISTLPEAERLRLEKLKDVTMSIRMDEEEHIFEFSILKPFKSVNDLESVHDQTNEAIGIVKTLGNKEGQAPEDQLDELTKTDQVIYTFKNNTFSRTQSFPETDDSVIDNDSIEEEELDNENTEIEADADEFGEQFKVQFEEIFAKSNYTLVYTFPKKIKSVKHEGATISEDGKTVTVVMPWDVINKDNSVMNLNIILED